jgi:hypothetical protein
MLLDHLMPLDWTDITVALLILSLPSLCAVALDMLHPVGNIFIVLDSFVLSRQEVRASGVFNQARVATGIG